MGASGAPDLGSEDGAWQPTAVRGEVHRITQDELGEQAFRMVQEGSCLCSELCQHSRIMCRFTVYDPGGIDQIEPVECRGV